MVERILEFDGTIASESWFEDDITPRMFKDELYAEDGDVTIWINSPGGDCIAASQIYAMLMEYKGNITVKIDGVAASAASVIAMAGTTVLMAPTAMMMIHNPATMAAGDHNEMEKAIQMLEQFKEGIITAYEIKTGMSATKLSHLMEDETWMNAKKAIELGFADGMLEDEKRETNPEAFEFSSKAVERAVFNRIVEKCNKAAVTNEVRVETKPEGRMVDDLKARLITMKEFI